MPIAKDNIQITAVISKEEHKRILERIEARRKSGQKMTLSKYVALALRDYTEYDTLFAGNGQS